MWVSVICLVLAAVKRETAQDKGQSSVCALGELTGTHEHRHFTQNVGQHVRIVRAKKDYALRGPQCCLTALSQAATRGNEESAISQHLCALQLGRQLEHREKHTR